jgi:cytochrome c oxidase subunit 2
MYFTPTEAGTYVIYCAEFCGTNHSQMRSQVVVHPNQGAYDEWVAGQDTSAMPLATLGRRIYDTRGCTGCHSDDGSRRVGPSFKGLWGRTEALEGGGSVTVDENYVRESIVEPRAKVAAGYPPAMPPTPLTDREILGFIEYLKSLR